MSAQWTRNKVLAEVSTNDDGRIVVLDWGDNKFGNLSNLVRLNKYGGKIWTAALPPHSVNDCFTTVAWDGPLLRANTYSGYAIWVDPRSGEHVRLRFGK